MHRHNKRAVRVVIQHIDRHPDEFNSTKTRHAMMTTLIKSHRLKDLHGRLLDANALYKVMTGFALHSVVTTSNGPKTPVLFLKGSSVLTPEALERLDIQRVVPDSQKQSEGSRKQATEPQEAASSESPLALAKKGSEEGSNYSDIEKSKRDSMEASADVSQPSGDKEGAKQAQRISKPRTQSMSAIPAKAPVSITVAYKQTRETEAPAFSPLTPVESTIAVKPAPKRPATQPNLTADSPAIPIQASGDTAAKQSDGRNGSQSKETPADVNATSNKPLVKRSIPLVEIPDDADEGPRASKVRKLSDEQNQGSITKEATPRRPAISPEAKLLVPLGNDFVTKELDGIWSSVTSFSVSLIKDYHIDGKRRAELVIEPSQHLESLYKRLFGEQWRGRATDLIESDDLKARDIIEACTGAAVSEYVGPHELPWPGPKHMMEDLSTNEGYMDEVFRETASPWLRLHFVVWQAARNKVLDKKFQTDTIRPAAERLADKFRMTISPQLTAIGGKQGSWQRKEELVSLLSRMLILNGLIRAAPAYYRRFWAHSGVEYNPQRYEAVCSTKGPQEVRWGVMPRYEKRQREDSEWVTVCRAKVFTRRSDR